MSVSLFRGYLCPWDTNSERAARAFGKGFRIYSVATFVALLRFGALTGRDEPRIAANRPTPWVGIWERIDIVTFLAW